ncbi:MAG: T9SS type A sorting domain-containing protein [Flavobacteriales bacterium]|nr:T9SS type A sorting domain-containing protein [Flavobacteriales bacterium]MCB9167194.1 T9SS type A sorting domain-containing protein [Flavobacteriales bacterium]
MKDVYTSLLTGALLFPFGTILAQSGMQKDGTLPLPCAHHVVAQHAPALRGTAPVNDECGSVTPQSMPIGGSLTFTGNNTGATLTNDYEVGSQLEGLGHPSVWHAFTTNDCTNLTISYCGSDAGFAGNFWIVISTACPAGDASMVFNSSYNTTECPDGSPTIHYSALPAGTYYLPVLTDEANGVAGNYTIVASTTACAAPPANDECAGAIPVTPGSWCNFAYFTCDGGTESLAGLTCNGYTGNANDDVWFSFVATSSTMAIGAQGTDDGDGNNNTGYDAVIELFSGTCGSLTSMDCADATLGSEPEEVVATGLNVGETYYVRVYDWYAGYPPIPTFGFCVVDGGSINLGLHDQGATLPWTIYPNPGTGAFDVLDMGLNGRVDVDVFDMTGRRIMASSFNATGSGQHHLDLGALAKGTYAVELTNSGVRTQQRLVID